MYRSRIGEPATEDEATGYWVFALGVILGIVGIWLFIQSSAASQLRQWAVVLSSAGLVLLVAGPIIRLPLRRRATWLVYLGVLTSAAAIVWFISAFPAQWSPQTGQPTIMALYAIGLLVMAGGGVFVPLMAGSPERDAELEAAQTERDEARETLAGSEADEADLAAQLRSLRQSQAQFELYEDRGGQWRWRLRHRNGNVIADSAEGYTRRHNAQKGMQSVRSNALGATVLLYEAEEELPEPETDDGFVFPDAVESRATFEAYEDTGGEFRWRLRHDNGDIIADSSEGYAARGGMERAIDRIREYVIDRIRDGIDDLESEVYEDSAGEHRWRLRGGNRQIVADSGEGYASSGGAEEALENVREYTPDADVLTIGPAAFEVYEDSAGDHRWRLRHRNGNILADSGQGYADRSGTWDGIESVKRNAPEAAVETTDE